MASSSSSSSKRFVKRGASARELVVKARGLDTDAVPFAKPSVNHYRISRAAIAEDVSPVMERSGVLLKKAPVGRKARFFVTRNHFLNYWDSKLDMICASKSPYGSINLLKVYRIAQKGQKITLSFPEDMQLKPVDVRAPTATVAKKWAKNMSTRRLHFENVYEEALRKQQKQDGGEGVRRGSALRNPIDARDPQGGGGGGGGGGEPPPTTGRSSRLSSSASVRTPAFPRSPAERRQHSIRSSVSTRTPGFPRSPGARPPHHFGGGGGPDSTCLLYTSPSPRDRG